MQQLIKIIVSNRVTLVLLLTLAVSMAVATFVENDHGTAVARQLVYEAWWFEVLLLWLSINFLVNLKRYRLLRWKTWPIALFHLAFVIIILGAGVTRYFSRQGMIHIREGASEHIFYSEGRYLQLQNTTDGSTLIEQPLTLNQYRFEPYSKKVTINDQSLTLRINEYIKGARPELTEGQDTLIDLAFTYKGNRQDLLLHPGEKADLNGLQLATGGQDAPVELLRAGTGWQITADSNLMTMSMSNQQAGILHAGDTLPLQYRTLYQWSGGAFIVKGIHEGARQIYVAETDEKMAKELPDAVALQLTTDDGTLIKEAYVPLSNVRPARASVNWQGKDYTMTYGPKPLALPFAIRLNRFELERYPGSQSPSSYASEVQVLDGETSFPYRVFMNNVLDYRGYRFYQASYDTDEKGTVLSINQDRPGTIITYLGYFLLTVGMFFTLFSRGSRFQMLNRQLSQLKKSSLLVILLFGAGLTQAAQPVEVVVPEEKAAAYGELVVQDLDGRMKPLNTLAGEIVRKLSGSTSMKFTLPDSTLELTPEQFLLAAQLQPGYCANLPLLKADAEKGLAIYSLLGQEPTGKLSFAQCLDEEGNYRLFEEVELANKLKPGERNAFHKELLKFDERFNILYGLLNGNFLRLFPDKEDQNHTWFTAQEWQQITDEEDARFVRNVTPLYMSSLQEGLTTDDWSKAEEVLNYIELYQQKAGESVYPSEKLLKSELLYNRLNLGTRLFGPFWLLGILLLFLSIALLFWPEGRGLRISWNILAVLGLIGFAAFTYHLGLRWYIAKHPPWSDGFEMLVFVAWGLLLFGYSFYKKTRFTIPLGLLFSGTLLFVAFLDWLNPEITNLMPVLHSYWLKIHVAVIVSGYAPLALSAVMGLLSLLLIIFRPAVAGLQWHRGLQELRMVNEMSMTIGLFLLTVGTFLGGVWANESWGRYWAWDPKETWALISIVVYAFILHLRLVPMKKSFLIFQLASLWAFASVIMTSFGVNYYLSGLHSYAKGDPVPIPGWVIGLTIGLLLISLAAIWRFKPVQYPVGKAKESRKVEEAVGVLQA